MNWINAGWAALAVSGAALLAAGWRHRAVAGIEEEARREAARRFARAVVEIALPVFFIASLGMLFAKDVMSFPAVLLLAVALTGGAWALDRATREGGGEPAWAEMARSFFPILLVVFSLRSFAYEPFHIPSDSMRPLLEPGDFILVNKYAWGIRLPVADVTVVPVGAPARGEVMVFRLPHEPSRDLIKRVVGLPGDRVSYRGRVLAINGEPVARGRAGEAIAADALKRPVALDIVREHFPGEAGTHQTYLVRGAPALQLAGVRDFPGREHCRHDAGGFDCTVPAGHYFVMGDNRDNSDDSRYWGFVPDRNIVGRAERIWMNAVDLKRIGQRL